MTSSWRTPDLTEWGRGETVKAGFPLISVVMAVHNGEQYVRLAIDSVLSQDFDDLELVIVDDASTDRTSAIIESCQDERVVCIRNQNNLGQTRSLNLGMQRARADLVARIDADDLYLPGKLTRQYAVMQQRPDAVVCGTGAIKIDADGEPFGVYLPPVRAEDIRFTLCQRVPVCHVSVIMRRDAIIGHGGYDESYRYAADYALWSAIARAGGLIVNIGDPLMSYREFVGSLGAVHKLGAAGEEGARILQENLATLAGLSISIERCRTIALMHSPRAGLSRNAIVRAYLSLCEAARGMYHRVPLRVRLELASALCWSLLKEATERRSDSTSVCAVEGTDETDLLLRNPIVLGACLIASAGARFGDSRVRRMKEFVMPAILRRLR